MPNPILSKTGTIVKNTVSPLVSKNPDPVRTSWDNLKSVVQNEACKSSRISKSKTSTVAVLSFNDTTPTNLRGRYGIEPEFVSNVGKEWLLDNWKAFCPGLGWTFVGIRLFCGFSCNNQS